MGICLYLLSVIITKYPKPGKFVKDKISVVPDPRKSKSMLLASAGSACPGPLGTS